MVSPDISHFLHTIELKTKKMLSGPLLSDWRSRRKGSGFEFYQLRDYQEGDDIRFIDWKSSAKTQKFLVREYLEDRNRRVILAVDMSASVYYGSHHIKIQMVQELAVTLAFIALHMKDSVGLLLFTNEIEQYIPPMASRDHVLALMNTLCTYTPKNTTTDINQVFKRLGHMHSQKSLLCLFSDFTSPFDPLLARSAARRHEVIAFRCSDARELSFPDVGVLTVENTETHERMRIATHAVESRLQMWRDEQESLLKKSGIDVFNSTVGKPFLQDLAAFLRVRSV
jgi:uncharacterized protein (DUF58 family)